MFEPSKIPGMIEPSEQRMLQGLAASHQVRDGGAIVEFGTFFGRSTACLANGALTWWTPDRRAPALHAYDSFGCAENGGLARHVDSFARNHGVAPLVRHGGGRIDFYPVFSHFVGGAEAIGLLKSTVTELRDVRWSGGPIALMHIDAPKFYEELSIILQRFFPSLIPGGFIVFQDYFYHWSAGLIAGIQLLVEGGFIRMDRSFASSCVAHVLKVPSLHDMLALDRQMAAANEADLIARAIASVGAIRIDRPEAFLGRLHLARMQTLWVQGDFPAAKDAFLEIIKTFGRVPAPVFTDFTEMMEYGFDIRRLYDIDH